MKNHFFKRNRILILLILVGSLGPLSSDAYLPAISLMTNYFNVSDNAMKLSVSVYFWGFLVSQFIFGPLSDFIGRKKVILFGLLVGVIGSVLCFVAKEIETFYIGRFVLGVGMASGVPVGRAILKDVYEGKELARAASYLNMVFSLFPFLSPLIGAYIYTYFSWQMIFEIIFILIVFIFVFFFICFDETNRKLNKEIFKKEILMLETIKAIKNRNMIVYGLCTFCAFGSAVAYIVSAPYIFVKNFDFTIIEYSYLTALITFSYLIGGLVNSYMLKAFLMENIIKIAFLVMSLSSFYMILSYTFYGNNIYNVIVPILILMISSRLVFPSALSLAFAGGNNNSNGIMGSIYGFYHTSGAVFSTFIISVIDLEAIELMSLMTLFLSILGVFIIFLGKGFLK